MLAKDTKHIVLAKDIALITIMAVLAACGIIYQYLLSSYAGRILGLMEHAIFTMIGVMIVSMGIGAFAAKLIKSPYSAFAWLEIVIAFFGASGILIIGATFAFAHLMPIIISQNYGLPSDIFLSGNLVIYIESIARIMPYIIGFIIGILIGMEIPFIARVREDLYRMHITHNVGTIYGADYIGAGIGAAIFITYMLTKPPETAAIATAIINLLSGLFFLFLFYKKIKSAFYLLIIHILFALLLIFVIGHANSWNQKLEDMLYQDKVVYSKDTPFQHITLTKRIIKSQKDPIYALYLNGRTQFSSDDEHIYHEMLVYPAMLAAKDHKNILVIGGGDGLALRDILKWNPSNITLLELDQKMVELFSGLNNKDDIDIKRILTNLNNNSFSDQRIQIIYGDAFNTISKLGNEKYDVIIIDLPDPSHPNLNKLYSAKFYKQLYHLLDGDGVISIQSTSPYHAKLAFLTVGTTLKYAGFKNIQRYQQNVPSFGQWGWTIATKFGTPIKSRIKYSKYKIPKNSWANRDLILASFAFGNNFFDEEKELQPNRLGSNLMYFLHQKAWEDTQ